MDGRSRRQPQSSQNEHHHQHPCIRSAGRSPSRAEKRHGDRVKVIAKGTGAALRDGMDGNVDVLFVHAKEREETFVRQGYGTARYPVMKNDFVILGPPRDPAKTQGQERCSHVSDPHRPKQIPLRFPWGRQRHPHQGTGALEADNGGPGTTQNHIFKNGKKDLLLVLPPPRAPGISPWVRAWGRPSPLPMKKPPIPWRTGEPTSNTNTEKNRPSISRVVVRRGSLS